MSNESLKAIVLAAGKGTRMRTDGCDLPKVMRLACGQPLLHYVLDELRFLPREDTVLVVGYQKEVVTAAFPDYPAMVQDQQLGTGHAVMCAMPALDAFDGDVLICYGDMPLIQRSTYDALIRAHQAEGNACTMLTGTSDVDLPYGRIERDSNGKFLRIVEQKDCTPEQLKIRELNVGVYVFHVPALREALTHLKNNNASGEYYLTDAPEWLMQTGQQVGICKLSLGREIIGVNTPQQLAEVEETLNSRKR